MRPGAFSFFPFALSLSKGKAELVEAFSLRLRSVEGFDKLSPNGFEDKEAVHG